LIKERKKKRKTLFFLISNIRKLKLSSSELKKIERPGEMGLGPFLFFCWIFKQQLLLSGIL